MNTSMLDYYKLILSKVSFDRQILSKEYRKALNMLGSDEAGQLDQWLKEENLDTKLRRIGHNNFNEDARSAVV